MIKTTMAEKRAELSCLYYGLTSFLVLFCAVEVDSQRWRLERIAINARCTANCLTLVRLSCLLEFKKKVADYFPI